MTAAAPAIHSLVLIAKQPVPGRVKTRLIGERTAQQAADLAAAAIADTVRALNDFPCHNRVLLFDGDPAGVVADGWQLITQTTGGLDERLSAGFDALPAGPALLVGMDTPQLTADLLRFDPANYDACLGLAADGGFWTIGFTDPRQARGCILGVPMSTAATGTEQLRRLTERGLSVQSLPVLTDVDTPDTAHEVALAAPGTEFAALWRQLGESAA
jgi:glycosyltransferase A (GT-A) superfamily protein (DUF2064 family)